MPDVEVFAFPALLVASYVVYRLGRRRTALAPSAFDAARLAFQGGLLGTLAAVGARLVAAGALQMPLGWWAPALAVTGVAGLIAVDVVDLARRRQVATTRSGRRAAFASMAAVASVDAPEGAEPAESFRAE